MINIIININNNNKIIEKRKKKGVKMGKFKL